MIILWSLNLNDILNTLGNEKIDQYLSDHPRVKFILPQALLLVFIFSIIGYFSFNASSNLSARGIDTGFGFLKNKHCILYDIIFRA